MELEALQGINSKVRALGAQIVVLTRELERNTRALHKKLNLTFDMLTDLHLKTAEQFRLVFTLPHYLRDLYVRPELALWFPDTGQHPSPERSSVERKLGTRGFFCLVISHEVPY